MRLARGRSIQKSDGGLSRLFFVQIPGRWRIGSRGVPGQHQDASRIRSKQFRSESSYLLLVGETGFEPATPWSRTRCSTRLSHSPKLDSLRGREEVTGRTKPVNPVVAGPAPACRSVLAGASCAAP